MPATVTTDANTLPSAERRGIVDETSREAHCTDTANGGDGRPIGDCLSDAIRHRSDLLPDEQKSEGPRP